MLSSAHARSFAGIFIYTGKFASPIQAKHMRDFE